MIFCILCKRGDNYEVTTGKKKRKREQLIKLWTKSWTEKNNLGIEKVFAPDVHYIRSWGPEYHGLLELQYWFSEKNDRATIIKWDINGFMHDGNATIAHWDVEEKKNKKVEHLEGISLIRWNEDEKVEYVQHFASNMNRFDPYQNTDYPNYSDQQIKRFNDLHN
ncbi:nuclear transport factor 2 family protein [Lactobacillus sp. PV034]|uniref:nuclear transport factor 2 family protein n=1 Tax=Lactobacillus sp. PV034 TaxID=2594495 RepID=UPI00223EE1E6|nr:nuclear transport factor 2 family protein [Lactobacillus sp. PV034]